MKCSIICVVRNDGYGIHQRERTINFLKSLDSIPVKNMYEIIFVEWNPISTNKSFVDEYFEFMPTNIDKWVVEIPPSIHSEIENPHNLPVFEYYGKNVGARNSNGDFLIFTNPDNVFYTRTWKDIIDNISENHFLRLCRADVRFNHFNESDDLDTITKNLMNDLYFFYAIPGAENEYNHIKMDEINYGFEWDTAHCAASGDFFGVTKQNFHKIKGYRESFTYSSYDSIILFDSMDLGLKQKILPKYSIHIDHSRPHIHRVPITDERNPPPKKDNWGLVDYNIIKKYKI